jgi:hypothetical protein
MLESVKLRATPANDADARLKKLAASIEALAEKDVLSEEREREITATRSAATAELYAICSEFVLRLIQINVRGRILQIEYEPTPELISTEEFRVPYTLSGAVRAFNHELLAKDLIEEQLIFFTLEKHRRMWRFFDPRTYRSGPLDREYLVCLMEQLI